MGWTVMTQVGDIIDVGKLLSPVCDEAVIAMVVAVEPGKVTLSLTYFGVFLAKATLLEGVLLWDSI